MVALNTVYIFVTVLPMVVFVTLATLILPVIQVSLCTAFITLTSFRSPACHCICCAVEIYTSETHPLSVSTVTHDFLCRGDRNAGSLGDVSSTVAAK